LLEQLLGRIVFCTGLAKDTPLSVLHNAAKDLATLASQSFVSDVIALIKAEAIADTEKDRAIRILLDAPMFLDVNISGSGTVTATPNFNCGANCYETVDVGSMVTLTAKAETGSTFIGWSGVGCSGTDPCTVTMSTDVVVVGATFQITGRLI